MKLFGSELTPEQEIVALRGVDKDGDGRVTFEELMKFMGLE
jgi:Ca2+-binding EF-hand superfamily protein